MSEGETDELAPTVMARLSVCQETSGSGKQVVVL